MDEPVLEVFFYATNTGGEPVRKWLKSLPREERLLIGEDIKAVQYRWPVGMPLVRKLSAKVWEVRTHLPTRIARVLYCCQRCANGFAAWFHQESASYTANRYSSGGKPD